MAQTKDEIRNLEDALHFDQFIRDIQLTALRNSKFFLQIVVSSSEDLLLDLNRGQKNTTKAKTVLESITAHLGQHEIPF